MQMEPSALPDENSAATGVATATIAGLSTHWSAVRGELEVFAILTQSLTTSSRLATESLARLERDSAALLQEFQARQARLEEEIAVRTDELERIRRQIETERVRAGDAEREGVAAREAAERQVAAMIASGQRHAEELVVSAQRRAADIEREAAERRSAILAESESLETQVRDLDERITRLLGRSRGGQSMAGGLAGALPPVTAPPTEPIASPPPTPIESAAPQPAQAAALPPVESSVVSVDPPPPPSSSAVEAAAPVAAFQTTSTPATERDRIVSQGVPPIETPVPATAAQTEVLTTRRPDEHEMTEDTSTSSPRPFLTNEGQAERSAAVEHVGPATTTLTFYEVPGFQAVLAVERALKGLPRTQDVVVGEFDERRLTMDVTHEMGEGLSDAILGLDNLNLELLRTGPDRAEFAFRA